MPESCHLDQSKDIHKGIFCFESPRSPLEIALAWAVLLKDYVGSTNVQFLYGDFTSVSTRAPGKIKTIDLVLNEKETLEELFCKIGEQLTFDSEKASTVQSSSLKSQLCVSYLESEISNGGKEEKEEEGVEGENFSLQDGKIDLEVNSVLSEEGRTIHVTIIPKSVDISSKQALRVLHQFEQVLHQVQSPMMGSELVYSIKTASHSDLRDVWKWNHQVPESPKSSALEIFSDYAKHQPDALAVHAWDGDLSYQNLDEISTRLSLSLAEAGVRRGNIVPLCFEKSMWTIVAIWAVVKTGAAFVLLDENLPQDRLRQIVNLIGQKSILVLASAAQYHRAMDLASVVVVVDSHLFEMEPTPHESAAEEPVKASDLLYVVFTSGTTGVPKAAMIRHSNMCSLVAGFSPMGLVTSKSRILAWASFAFDVSLENVFLSLLSGACICIPSSWECKNDVARLLRNYQITHVHITPSAAKLLQPSEAPRLSVLQLGGEQCSEDVLARWRGTTTRVVNCYGPAECTVVSVANESLLHSARPSIIGKGLGACWIMDPVDRHRLTPVGGIGELVLEGPLVGGGYLHDQASTQAKFFEDPEWLLNGFPEVSPGRKGRLYRTGDFVRYTDDGLIEYIGRRDLQVKIRGQRLELGELAAHLQELMPTSIRWCPEVARLNNGAELLVVFLVLLEDTVGNTENSLRATIDLVDQELRRRVQPVMIPGAYTRIDQIPLSLSGKTDHRKLKQIASSLKTNQLFFPRTSRPHLENGNAYASTNGKKSHHGTNGHCSHAGTNGDRLHAENVATSHLKENGHWKENGHLKEDGHPNGIGNSDENASSVDSKLENLKLLWSQVLNVEPEAIRPSDTFFSHGGESLSAIKLVGAAARRGLQIDVAMIFRHPQLSELALRCRPASTSSSASLKAFSLLKDKQVLQELARSCGRSVDDIEDAYPCTPMQEGLMTGDDHRGATYIGREVLTLPRHIDAERLARAWRRVAATHSILRTRIVDTESHGLLQVVLKDSELLSSKGRRSLANYLEEDDHKRMDFGTPLCRWSFVREPQSTHFALTMHHALYDGWTLPRIGAEVFKAYQGMRIQPAVGFNAFIEHVSMLPAKKANDFWARQLAEPGRTTFFPTIPHSVQEPRADSVISKTFAVPANANNGVSIPSLLRAAWALLVAKLSGTDDVTFGVTVSGRNIPITGIEDLLSPTISTVPVRVKLNGNENTKSFVARVQSEALEAMPFENMGLQNIRKVSSDTREGSKFQTLFIVHPPGAAPLESSLDAGPAENDLKAMLESLDISHSLSNFNEYALMVVITQKAGNLVIEASYDSQVLESAQAGLLLDQFAHVAEQLGCQNNLERSLETLNLASGKELEAIWNWNSKRLKGRQELISDVIARTIALQPDAEAICAWDGRVTFADVEKLSLRLAQVLYSKGVRRGSLVPICMEKSKWAAIAMLGIMRTGAGFVALDVRHQPEQRLRTIIKEIRADWVVTAGPTTALARKLSVGAIACDHLSGEEAENADYDNLPTTVSPSPADTAFVVFTSGTTGIPKGIIITHENFSSTIQYHENELQLSRASRIYDFASYSFDIAVHNALMSLAVGGCLCVPSEDDRENDIEGSFERLKANWADITPSVARLVDPAAVPSLKTLVLSGEAIPKDLVSQWVSKVELINAYGPAETQICTIQPRLRGSGDAAKIGRGFGCLTWIIDLESETLSLIGAIGELVIEGPIVSPGYLNAPGDAFVQDPSWLLQGSATVPGRRGIVYRTGDLARYQPDGTIIYAGRATTQTKINGQRVELNEIEFHVQHALPESRNVVADVVTFDEISRLCVFILYHQSGNATTSRSLAMGADLLVELAAPPSGLQDRLKGVLPDYMVPSVFLNISHVPLTATRKIDRQRLKDFAARISRHEIQSIHQNQKIVDEPELDQKQQTMLFLWAQVLKLQFARISLGSDFFQLGGDSISAMRLVKSARKQGLAFTVADVLRSPRFENLCSVANERNEDDSPPRITFDTVRPFALSTVSDKNVLAKSAAAFCNVVPEDIVDIYPCTPFQEGVFALTATQGSDFYVQHTQLEFSQTYELERILAAWDSVIASNSILRTRIIQADQGSLMQVVIRETQKWQHYDSSKDYFMDAAKKPMGPGCSLSRFALVRNLSQSSPTYTIIWTIHHALYDAWTMSLILRQVSRSYHARKEVEFGPDYNVFVQFLNRQRAQSERWWQSNLAGASDAAVFPKMPLTDQTTAPSCSKRKSIALPRVLPPGYTMAVLLRCAWAIVMERHTGGESVLFGEVRLGRNIPIKGVEMMRGPTISSVPVLVHVDREKTVGSLLDGVRETSIQMQEFEHLGMQNISRINEDARAACNFQTILVLQENQEKTIAESIFKVDSIDDIRNFNSWELMIIFHQSSKGLVAEALFRESTISAELVELLLQQTQSILHSLCALPTGSTLRQLDLTNQEDLSRIWDWNASAPETVDEYLHELVSKQAQRTPNGIAVLAHDGQMTYKELDEASSNLASQLLDRGVGVNSIVPLCFEKSALVPVAMLAVIKTGAAFSVMDVTYPESRLKVISDAMEARLILASSAQLQLAKRLVDNVFVVDDISCRSASDLGKRHFGGAAYQDTSRIMYVCYTSGSTGEPKGVMVTHRNLASASVAQTRELGFGIGDRVYDFSSHAFDANIWHTWWALISGACLCIPSYNDRMQNLAGSITSFRTTKLFLTPSVARTIDPTELPTVERLFLGGEAITKLDVSKWIGHLDLWCAYGPTETTPLSIFTRIHGPESASNIGRGIGVIPWICNPQDHNELMAIGAVGEMLLEGPLVTLGYRGQPEKTATIFIKNPSFLARGCGSTPGRHGILYKTGDFVRYAFDGTIEYIGRADTQVKLRGQRVEFGEIEFHLKNAVAAASSVVCEVVSHPYSRRPMLVAFCAFSSATHEMNKTAARVFLSKRLPPYMIPEAFLTLPEIPKNPSGKTDRQRLRVLGPQLWEEEGKGVSQHLAGPHTRMEALLEELWVTALNQPSLVLHQDDNFFEVGGDSIAVMKLSNLARKHELSLTVRDIMQHPTLSSMAMKTSHSRVSLDSPRPFSLVEPSQLGQTLAKAAMVCGISVESISDIYPCTPLQIELFALTMKQPQAYISRSVFEVPSHIDFSSLVRAWNTVIRINAVLRTQFADIEGLGLVQVVVKEQSCELYDSFETFLATNPAQADLGRPLSQIAGIPDEKSPKIVWTIHHALYDAWSVQIIEDQLRKAYRHQLVLSPPAYSGFVRHLRSQDPRKAEEFWRLRLKGCTSAAIYPSLPSPNYQVRPCNTFKRILRTSIAPGTNLQATIHAAWALIVSSLSETADVVFAATLAGRNSSIPGVEQMVGPTITPVPIRIHMGNPEQCIQELLENIGRDTAGMAPYQHIGTKTIELIDSDTQAACKFQTLLVVTPPNATSTHGPDAISTSTYEISSEKQEAFHTFALVLFFTPTQTGLALEVIFDPVILSHREVERLSGRLESVINALGQSRNIDVRISEIECLSKEDLDDIWHWNSEVPPSSECLLHDIILSHVQKRMEKVAIDAWDVKISYSELEILSENLASHLRKHAIGRGSVVPILSFKSGYVAVAALAVLRAGAAVLPLDASQPLQRLQAILEQVHSSVIFAGQSSTQIAVNLGATVLCIEKCLDRVKGVEGLSSHAITATPDDIACILWTSGSTGVPKGVMQTHRALSSAIVHQAAKSDFNEATRAFEFASYSFDVSWNMIFKILAVGGTLCVPNEDERQNDLVRALNRSAATLTELTASVARLINPNQLFTLETLIISGEFVDLRDFEHWTPKVRLIICYGPSECTSVSTTNTSGSNSDGIGKAISCVTWIVDPQNHRRLMPVGAVGEILIEGPNVGKGYYNNEVLTNSSYVSELPWLKAGYESRPGRSSIAFKSGDLARYDTNGNLHFVSRKDTQVKLRGQRIELEEVQHHVQAIMGDLVRSVIACVLQDPGAGKEKILAAFLSCENTATESLCALTGPKLVAMTTVETLDDDLRALLPKYMIPAAYYFVTSIPRTTNGKVDRKKLVEIATQALPSQIYRGRQDRQATTRMPSTLFEVEMQRFWAAALGIRMGSIGADDNFFNLNGDSISAMRLVAGARGEGYDLRVADIFKTPKLSELALKIQTKVNKEKSGSDIKPFELLGDSVDAAAIRSEVAAKCGILDASIVEDVYPCTPLQESMLAATIKDSRAFTSMRLYRVHPEVDLSGFQAAWATVVARNRILRTRLVDLKRHGLSQAVLQGHPSWVTCSSTQSFLESAWKEDMGLGTRLAHWVLIKEPHEFKFVWIIHHTIYDGWMLAAIEEEVKKVYFGHALLAPNPDVRPLVKFLLAQGKESSVSFWDQELKQANESTIFPSLPNHNYEPRPKAYLEKVISANMNSLPPEVNISAFLYGCWALLVSRITGNKKVAFGAILTGRTVPVDGIDRIMGPTITTVPILVDVDTGLSGQDFIARLREKTIEMMPHEHLGVSEIRRISATSAAACNFQTVLVIQPPIGTRDAQQQRSDKIFMEELDETKIEGFPNQHAILNQYGLMLEILPIGSNITVRASFDSQLISASQMERLINQWEHIIEQLSQSVSRETLTPLKCLDLLCQQDLDDVWMWNTSIPETVDNQFVHQAVSEITILQPEKLAIAGWDGQLTYGELDKISSRLAEGLVQAGIGPGCFVPLIFPKSMWANVSMLAVLKAGGAFVPLDADHPEGRLRAVMQLLKAEVILCSAQTRDRAARLAPHAMMVDGSFSLDDTRHLTSVMPVTTGRRKLQAGDLAYAVFTSGSTGAAKGVKISHTNLATAIRHQIGDQGFQINSKTRSLDSSSYSFDACVFNFFYTLTQGGCLCIPNDDTIKGDIGAFMSDYKVNWAQLVPSVARNLTPDKLTDLESLILTGEALTQGDINTWSRRVQLFNVYGPTECTILCAISSQISGATQAGNIGRGRGANLWLTEIGNPNRLAPVGAVGEILIEGPIIGAGYLGPYQFPLVVDPPWLIAGKGHGCGRQGTLFRTGDQARYTDDGTLIFIGRIGSEVKLRGQRVDLMEVEDIVRSHDPFGLEISADIVQIDLERGHDRQMLLLFISSHSATLPNSSHNHDELDKRLRTWIPDLKASLDASLPSYLQPEALVLLPATPKTRSGKTDRRRLKDLGKQLRLQQLIWISTNVAKTSSTPPSNQLEQMLADFWARALGIDSTCISREDSFFLLGGDSLGVMRLATVAHEHNILLKTKDIFETPILAQLAEKMFGLTTTSDGETYRPYSLVTEFSDSKAFAKEFVGPSLKISADQIEDILPANGFQVDYMNNKEEPLGLQYAYLDISSKVSWPKLVDACRAIVQSFQGLRARFVRHEGKYYQVILRDAPLVVEELVSNDQVTTFSNQFCAHDCRQAGVSDIFTKLSLVNTGSSKRRVILRMSHMQNDGWCTIHILKTIARVYNGEKIEKTPDWSSLLSYRQQAAQESRKYWRSKLEDSKNTTPPLVFKPGGSKVRTLRTFALPNFHSLGDNRRTRPTVVVNVAWALVLQKLAGHDDVVFGNVTTGRNGTMPRIDSVIGPCVNMLPLRLRLGADFSTGTNTSKQQLRDLVEASAQQVDERTVFEGLDWDDMVDQCTFWPSGTRYSSAVHFRNMAFEPELSLGTERLVVAWYELVAMPHWTTVLVYPEDDVLRLWLIANPAEIGDEGADDILFMLAGYVHEIMSAIRDDAAVLGDSSVGMTTVGQDE